MIVTGKVRADARAPSGFELDVENIEVLQRVPDETPFPITLKEHGVDFLMERRHLWLRTPRQSAILRVRATIMRAAAEYFDTNGFIRTDPPILTPNACEGTSELFEMDYFDDDKAYLTQSGQLYIESTALALGKVYSFGPTFRAEKSKTRRHLTEFWMIEPEVAFCELDGLMELAENFITHIVQTVLKHHRPDLKVIGRDTTKLEASFGPLSPRSPTTKPTPIPHPPPPRPIQPRLAPQARSILDDAHKAGKIDHPPHLRRRLRLPRRDLHLQPVRRPVMIHRYPAAVKAFYMQPDPPTPPRPSASTSSPPRATARSSAAPSASTATTSSSQRIEDHNISPSKPSSGTSTSAATGLSPIRASAWASSAPSPGSAASTTSAKPSPSPELSIASTPELRE